MSWATYRIPTSVLAGIAPTDLKRADGTGIDEGKISVSAEAAVKRRLVRRLTGALAEGFEQMGTPDAFMDEVVGIAVLKEYVDDAAAWLFLCMYYGQHRLLQQDLYRDKYEIACEESGLAIEDLLSMMRENDALNTALDDAASEDVDPAGEVVYVY